MTEGGAGNGIALSDIPEVSHNADGIRNLVCWDGRAECASAAEVTDGSELRHTGERQDLTPIFVGILVAFQHPLLSSDDGYSPLHPCNPKQAISYNRKMGNLCRELFGGFSSEGGRDHAMPVVDYALYISFSDPWGAPENPMIDRGIPLWEIVCHGIALYNPYTCTVNPTIKSVKTQMLALEYGTRPTFYYYSRFKTDPKTNWMGDVDLECANEKELHDGVLRMKECYDDFRKLAYLQELFIVRHECENGISRMEYSNGSVIITDVTTSEQSLVKDGKTIWEKHY